MSPERLNILVVSPRRTASSGCRSRCHRCSGPWTGSCARGGSTSSTWSFRSLATAIYARLHPARGSRPLEAAVYLYELTGDKGYKGFVDLEEPTASQCPSRACRRASVHTELRGR